MTKKLYAVYLVNRFLDRVERPDDELFGTVKWLLGLENGITDFTKYYFIRGANVDNALARVEVYISV